MNKNSFYEISNKVKKTGTYVKEMGVKNTGARVMHYMSTHNKYMSWYKRNLISKEELMEHRRLSEDFQIKPLISIVVPLYKTKNEFLGPLLDSVMNQSYENLELVLPDGSADSDESKRIVEFINTNYPMDSRIVYKKLSDNYGIAGNTNEGLDMASGDWIAFADHDDYLDKDALYKIVKLINEKPNLKLIYTDEDKVNVDGTKFFYPHIKPDFNMGLFLASNYICHFLCVRSDVQKKVGYIKSDFDGAQDYDFTLRAVETIGDWNDIGHVNYPLYHWRVHPESTAGSLDSKKYAQEAGRRALSFHLMREKQFAEAYISEEGEFYHVDYNIIKPKMITVIIYAKKSIVARRLLESLRKQDYEDYEILLYSSDSHVRRQFADDEEFSEKLKIIEWTGHENKYEVYNHAMLRASGDYILFADKYVMLKDVDTMTTLAEALERKEAAAAGSRIYTLSGYLHHAGLAIDKEKLVDHMYQGRREEAGIYFNRSRMTQDMDGLSSELLLVKKEILFKLGGFDLKLTSDLCELDLGLRIKEAGFVNHYEPLAKGVTVKNAKNLEKPIKIKELFRNKWENSLYKSESLAYNQFD